MQSDTINIPGYYSKIDYNDYWNLPLIVQYNFDLGRKKEIAFYNEDEEDPRDYDSLVAVWRIKSPKPIN